MSNCYGGWISNTNYFSTMNYTILILVAITGIIIGSYFGSKKKNLKPLVGCGKLTQHGKIGTDVFYTLK